MEDADLDRALVTAAFGLAADRGWDEVSVARAARAADLPLDRARGRFMGRNAILGRFGRIADQAALSGATTDGSNRDRLFDVLMRRIDVVQAHRGGVLALRPFLRRDPGLALALGAATVASMAWMLEAAGIPAQGFRGMLRANGLTAAWVYTLRAWEKDESADLSGTMAALDRALDRAQRAESWLRFGRDQASGQTDSAPFGDAPLGEVAPDPMLDPGVMMPPPDGGSEQPPPPAQIPPVSPSVT